MPIATGDTKVVDRGKGDGVYINTSGIGVIREGVQISPLRARVGDVVLVSGQIAQHGIAIMSVREGLEFETTLRKRLGSAERAGGLLAGCGGRRGARAARPDARGVSSVVNEIAAQARVGIRLVEAHMPIDDAVRGACEILGLDPLYVANEGKCIAIVAREAAEAALAAMRSHPLGQDAAIIGEVVAEHPGKVYMRSRIGGLRVVDMLSGEQLPRIC